MAKFCSFEFANDLVQDEAFSFSSAADQAAAREEATDLAERAYVKNDADAVGQAERLLYVLHAGNRFNPPASALQGAIWHPLAEAKLKALRILESEPTDVDTLEKRLRDRLKIVEEQDHTVLTEACELKTDEGLVIYAKNWFSSTHGFTHQLLTLVVHCNGPDELYPVFKELLENAHDEFPDDVTHRKLRLRWLDELKVNHKVFESLTDDHYTTESFALQNYRTLVASMPRPFVGLGMFASVEAVFVQVCLRMWDGLRARGFSEEAAHIFNVHSEKDVDHTEHLIQSIKDSTMTAEQCGRVLHGALVQLDVRHRMFSAIREQIRSRNLS